MLDRIKENKTIMIIIIIGFICAAALCAHRVGVEAKNNRVATVISESDLEFLASSEGMDKADYRSALQNAGLAGIVTPGELNTELNLWLPGGDSYTGSNAVVGLVEDEYQFSFVPIEGFKVSDDTDMVRVFQLIPEYALKYAVLGYDGIQEIENILYRAVTDRNIRVVWLTPFVDSRTGETVTDPNEYAEVLNNLSSRISKHGLVLGDSFSIIESFNPPALLITGVFWGTVMAGILLLLSLGSPRKRLYPAALISAALPCGAAYYLAPLLSVQLFSLVASVTFPSLALWLIADRLQAASAARLWDAMKLYGGILVSAAGISILGGLFVGAMQSSSEYLLAVNNFRGVKLSQLVPVIFAVYIVLRRLYGGSGPCGVLREMVSGKKIVLIAAVALLLCAVALFILRTGDGLLVVGTLEQRFRNFLEHLLIARPRTKEFLISWPCLAVAFTLVIRGLRSYAWLFAVLAAPGLSSIANTFCHSRAPLWLSLTRSVLALIIGLALGLVILCFAHPGISKELKKERD